MLMEGLFWLLLPVAAYSGWYAATKHYQHSKAAGIKTPQTNPSEYSEGIATLISEQPDRAVDIVINQVDVTPDTVEVHMALGNLYRRTGQVDRAIRLHQNLTEKLSLNPLQREQVLFELGQDYLSSGLYDRAERIFKDLLLTENFSTSSAKALVEIYQNEKDWEQAIEALHLYKKKSGKNLEYVESHFRCEMAEKARTADDLSLAKEILMDALHADKSCIRANLMLAEVYYSEESFRDALKHYLATVNQDGAYLSEIIEPMIGCLEQLKSKNNIVANIPSLLNQIFSDSHELALSQNTSSIGDRKKAFNLLEQQLDKKPSVKLLKQYLFLIKEGKIKDKALIEKVHGVLQSLSEKEAAYRCEHCGFMSHNIQWQCPSCSTWSSIKPV